MHLFISFSPATKRRVSSSRAVEQAFISWPLCYGFWVDFGSFISSRAGFLLLYICLEQLVVCFEEYWFTKTPNLVYISHSIWFDGNLMRRKVRGKKQPTWRVFSLKELHAATNNFNYDNKLGEGGFGSVYWGQLWDGSQVITNFFSLCLYFYSYLCWLLS